MDCASHPAVPCAVKMLVKSGLLTFAISVGVDFLVIYYLYYALPLFFAGLDFIMCMVDFFFPSGWGEQLRCSERACFKGPSAMTDLLIFTSVPVVLNQFGTILEVTLNSGTGRRYTHSEPVVFRHSHSHTRGVGRGRFAGNFAYDAGGDIAGLLQSFYPSAALEDCTSCFKCKVCSPRTRTRVRILTNDAVHAVSGSALRLVDRCLRFFNCERDQFRHVPRERDKSLYGCAPPAWTHFTCARLPRCDVRGLRSDGRRM